MPTYWKGRNLIQFAASKRHIGLYPGPEAVEAFAARLTEYTLANRMGLSTQVPLTEEITSNFAPAQIRELAIKNRKYILRRPVVEVTDENVAVLQFLDCLKDLEKCAEEEPEACGRILTGYAREHALTRAVVDRFLAKYPLKIYKAIYETGIDFGTIDADRG